MPALFLHAIVACLALLVKPCRWSRTFQSTLTGLTIMRAQSRALAMHAFAAAPDDDR